MPKVRLETDSAEQTERAGAALAAGLIPGDVVLVQGELGSGKTTFVKGACRALGVTDTVASPTYVIGRSYAAPVPVSHIDLYRLDALDGEDPALLADYITPQTISFVEWPERAGESGPADPGSVAARVRIAHLSGDGRLIEASGRSRALDGLDTANAAT